MKNKFRVWVAYLNYRLGIYKLTSRYLADYPKATRLFNNALPVAMVIGVFVGLSVLVWQVSGLARPGEASISLPENGSSKSADFHARMVFRASQDRQPFNFLIKLDGRVIESRVGSAIKKGEVREYNFSSGVNGANVFNKNLIRPGEHTMRVEARTGATVGQGTEIDTDNVNFTVKDVANIAALGEPTKTINVNQLPLSASPRSAAAPLLGIPEKLLANIFPKALAHSGEGMRHGDIRVFTKQYNGQPVPGVPVQVGHPVLDACHEGNARTTDGSGVTIFTNCPVSNIGGSEATYAVHVFATPAGYSIDGPKERTMTVRHNLTSDIHFYYNTSAAPQPGDPTPGTGTQVQPLNTEPKYNYQPDDGPLISLTGLTATSATVDAFGMQMGDNHVINFLGEISAWVDGNKVSTVNSFGPHATQSGINLPLPNIIDGADHKLAFVATNQNGKSNTLNIQLVKSAPSNGGTQAAPVDTPAANPNKGSIAVSVFAHDQAGQAIDKNKDGRVGAVYISTQNTGSNVDQCERQNGLTANSREPSDNFGRIHFRGCPVALKTDDNHAKKYRVSLTMPDGFQPDPGFNASINATVQGNVVTREITVRKGQETEVSFLVVGKNTNTIKPPSASVQANTGGSNSGGTGGTPFPSSGIRASGVMVLYSDQGRYDRAMISVDTAKGPTIGGVPNTEASCGGIRLSTRPNERVVVALDKSAPRQIRCSSSSFFVNFFKPGQSLDDRGPQDNNPRVSPSINANHCTYVHKSGITRILPIASDGKCSVGEDSAYVLPKHESVLTGKYRPFPIIIGQSYTYEHELRQVSGEPMSPVECAGDINIIHLPLNDPGRRYPIHYNSTTKTCTFKQQVSSEYSAKLKPKSEQLKLVFDGNDYLKPSSTIINFERRLP